MQAGIETSSAVRIGNRSVPPLAACIGLTFLGLLLASVFNLIDPMVRHDDFPALLADPSGYYSKTLYEGRWLNYLWHLRGVTPPAWVNYLIYQFCWAVYGASVAHSALGPNGLLWKKVALALLIVLGPPSLLISLWFNTLLPGVAVFALFAFLNTQLPERHMRALLLVFVPLSLMSYTTYPLFLLVALAARADTRRGALDLFKLLALFVGSFALGLAVIFSLNGFAHGVFGVPMAPWRNPVPAHDLQSALVNMGQLKEFFYETARVVGFGFLPLTWLNLALMAAACVVVGRKSPWRVIYLLSVLAAGWGLVFLQTVKSGITLPVRVNGFSWAIYAILLVLMIEELRQRGGWIERLSRNVLLFLVMAYGAGTIKQYLIYDVWQSRTREIAADLGSGPEPVLITGTYKSLIEASRAGIQRPRGLRLRLTYLTGRVVNTCEEKPELCGGLPMEMRSGTEPGTALIHRHGGVLVLQLSPEEVTARGK